MNAGMKIDGIEKKSNVGYIFSAIVRGGGMWVFSATIGFFIPHKLTEKAFIVNFSSLKLIFVISYE